MPTTTTSPGVFASRAWKRRATASLCTPGRRWVSWATTPTTAASTPATRTATTWGPCARPASRRRWRGADTRGLPRAREVAVTGADEDGALAPQVADRHRSGGHGRPGAGAGVGRDPLRAADRGDAVVAVRPEAAAVVLRPQLALRRLALRR